MFPVELFLHVASFLALPEVERCRALCHEYHDALDSCMQLWMRHFAGRSSRTDMLHLALEGIHLHFLSLPRAVASSQVLLADSILGGAVPGCVAAVSEEELDQSSLLDEAATWRSLAHASYCLEERMLRRDGAAVRVVSAESGIKQPQGHHGHVQGVRWSPSGQRLAVYGADPLLRVFQYDAGARDLQCRATYPGHASAIMDACFAADGSVLATASMDATVRLWGVGGCLSTLQHESPVNGVRMCGQRALSCTRNGRVSLWDLETGACLSVDRTHTGSVYNVSFAAPFSAVSCGVDHRLVLRDLREDGHGEEDGELAHPSVVFPHTDVVYCCDVMGNLAVTGSSSDIKLWDLRRDNAPLASWPVPHPVFCVRLDEVKAMASTVGTSVLLVDLAAVAEGGVLEDPVNVLAGVPDAGNVDPMESPIYGMDMRGHTLAFGVGGMGHSKSLVKVADFGGRGRTSRP